MASEQTTRRSNNKEASEEVVEKDRVPKMTTHFENLSSPKKQSDQSKDETALSPPSLEETGRLRAQAQQKSGEAIRAAEEKYAAALKLAKQGVSSAAETGSEAAVGAKDRAVAAGWTAAHFSTETAVDGTYAAARAVKGAAEKAAEIAVKPISAAKEAVVSAGETAKEYTARKKEEAHSRGFHAKQETDRREEEEEEEEEEDRNEYEARGQSGSTTSVLGAIGETIVEIAQTTKDLVIGEDDTKIRGRQDKHYTTGDRS